MLHRVLRWRALAWPGWEHLEVRESAGGIDARGVIIGEFDGVRYGAAYRAALDSNWVVRSIRIERTDGETLTLLSDGAGRWTDGDGRPLEALDGGIDIDLSGSPFTNTLPIRRHRFTTGKPEPFDMAWIPLSTLRPFRDGQVYTRLADGRFRYQAADRSFEQVIEVDADGFVVRYPTLFEAM
jgi:uncharacterized protein